MAAGDVFVHLFEWKWTDIATECESVLGPAGFAAVQVSPPQEHSITPSHDWSERYQPVSYSIARSRSGTGAEFADMVNRCKAVGVGIIVDAVINHMTNFPSPGVGSNGTAYTKYEYPGPLHPGRLPSGLHGQQLPERRQRAGLRAVLAARPQHRARRRCGRRSPDYLIMLARLGVAGFRIDAAKHIQQVELDDILAPGQPDAGGRGPPAAVLLPRGRSAARARRCRRATTSARGTAPAARPTSPNSPSSGVGDKFRGVGGQHISQLNPNGPPGNQFSEAAWGLMPSDKAVVFLQNHDTQHHCGLGYRDGDVFRLANVWMLAQPYGYPSILSSYAFACPGGQLDGSAVRCRRQHQRRDLRVEPRDRDDRPVGVRAPRPVHPEHGGFRRVVAGTDINHWWDNGANAIAFSRGDKGFVAINRRDQRRWRPSVTTGPAARHLLRPASRAGSAAAGCAGTSVVVDATGAVQVNLTPDVRGRDRRRDALMRIRLTWPVARCPRRWRPAPARTRLARSPAAPQPSSGVDPRRCLLRSLRPVVLRQRRRRRRRPERPDPETRLHQRRQPCVVAEPRRSCIWLMPVAESPSYHGYDVSDYYRVEPAYGTNDDFKRSWRRRTAAASPCSWTWCSIIPRASIPAFQAALRDTASPFRAWYRFSPRRSARGHGDADAWHKSPVRERVLLRRLLERHAGSGLPHSRGSRGGEEDRRRSGCVTWAWTASGSTPSRTSWRRAACLTGCPGTHAFLHEYAAHIDSIAPAAYTVGEAWGNIDAVLPYYPDQLTSYFGFELADSLLSAVRSGIGGGNAVGLPAAAGHAARRTAGRRS